MIVNYSIILGASLLGILLFDVLAALISRMFQVKYAYISFFSLFLYLFIGYMAALHIHQIAALTIAGLVGLVDGLVGWKITQKIYPHISEQTAELLDDDDIPVLPIEVVLVGVLFSMGTGWIGSLFA